MAQIEPSSLAVGAIFDYSNPIQPGSIIDWFDSTGYDVPDMGGQSMAIGQSGVSVGPGIQLPGPIARKNGLVVIYHPESNLDGGFPNSSFLTIKDNQRARFDVIINEWRDVLEGLEEFDIVQDITLFELTLEGDIRIDENHNISNYISNEQLSEVSEISGVNTRCGAVRFESEEDAERLDYFEFLADATAKGNPRTWQSKYVTRFEGLNDINEEDVTSTMIDLANVSKDGE